MNSRLKTGHLILIFAMAALPFAATFAFYYPDERHYSDGALGMLKDHDWLIPKTAAGEPRFQKPPVAYWAVAASYAIFGVNVIASRLPFLLASCGTLFLTFRLARKLTGNPETALVAAVVLAAHPQFFLCSIRSIPDALLVFFTTLSAFGFLRLIIFEEFCAGAFWMAYGGAAGAVLSKGLLGIVIIGFAWAFFILKNRSWRAVKKIIHFPIFIASIIFAGSWFACFFFKEGAAAFGGFFSDQVTGNIHGHFWSPLARAPQFARILFFDFLPWSATAIEFLARRKNLKAGAVPPLANNFIVAWTIVLVLGFALGANVSPRYLLPAAPLFAILIADCVQRSESVRLFFSVSRVLKIILAALVLADASMFYVDSQWPLPTTVLTLTCVLFLFVIVVLALGALWRKSIPTAQALGLAILLFWPMLFFATTPVLLPDRSQQIVSVLKKTEISRSKPILFVGNVQLASRTQVCLGKDWTLTQQAVTPLRKFNFDETRNFDTVLLPEEDVSFFENGGWKIRVAAANFAAPSAKEIWQALKSRNLPEMLSRHTQKIILATRD
jgi:4-amino-4-deoxy-L-arabinose transferase-like glycosyltransferase